MALVLALGADNVQSGSQPKPAADLRSQAHTSSLAGTNERSVPQGRSSGSTGTVPGTRGPGH